MKAFIPDRVLIDAKNRNITYVKFDLCEHNIGNCPHKYLYFMPNLDDCFTATIYYSDPNVKDSIWSIYQATVLVDGREKTVKEFFEVKNEESQDSDAWVQAKLIFLANKYNDKSTSVKKCDFTRGYMQINQFQVKISMVAKGGQTEYGELAAYFPTIP